MDYNFLLNMRFSVATGPMDLSKGSWIYSDIDYTGAGRFSGESCDFNGTTSSLSKVSGNECLFDTYDPFTISVWLKFNSNIDQSITKYIISNGDNTDSNCVFLDDNLFFNIKDNNGHLFRSYDIHSKIKNNNWNHFAIIRTEEGRAAMFLNGNKCSQWDNNLGKIDFGNYNTQIGKNYRGSLDDIALCTGAYPITDIAQGTHIITIEQKKGQTIHVWTPQKEGGTDHTSSFTIDGDISYEAEVVPDIGYGAGDIILSPDDENIDATISVPNNYLSIILNPNAEEDAVGWEDKERIYSRYDDIVDITEWKRFNTYSMIDARGNGLSPYIINPDWHITDTYFLDGKYHVNRTYYQINISFYNIPDNYLFSSFEKEKRRFVMPMQDAFNKHYTNAFFLFIDGKLIPWSRIIITRSDKFVTATVSGFPQRETTDDSFNDVCILCVPFDISYSETGRIDDDAQMLYHFDSDGVYGGYDIIIGAKPNYIRVYSYDKYDTFTNFYVDANMRSKLTESNFTVFDNNGLLRKDASVTVNHAGNFFSIKESENVIGYSTVICFNERENNNEDYFRRLRNHTNYVKYLVTNGLEDETDLQNNKISMLTDDIEANDSLINAAQITKQFDFAHSKDKSYSENISNSIEYIFDYDKNKYDRVYEKCCPIVIVPMDLNNIIHVNENKPPIDPDITYNVTITQKPGQTIHVWTPQKEGGTDHTSSFVANSGTKYEDEIIAKPGYTAGTLSVKDIGIIDVTNPSEINPEVLRRNYYFTISRNIYDDKTDEMSQTYPVVFVNGEIPIWYGDGIYTNETCTWYLNEYNKDDVLEVVYFRNIRNELIQINEAKEDAAVNEESSNMDIIKYRDDFYIDKEDTIIYTDYKGETTLLPVRYSSDEITKTITLLDPRYITTNLYLGSMNQFRYSVIPINQNTNTIPLPSAFSTCYNTQKFMVFINGRLLNSMLYRVVIPKLTDARIKNKAIYTLKTVGPGDRVEVIYYGGSSFNRVNYNGDLVFKTVKVYATEDNQDTFVIPIPFKGYQIQDTAFGGFMLFKDSLLIDDSRYYVYEELGVYYLKLLNWDDRAFVVGDSLVFIFPYYKSDWQMSDEISNSNTMQFITRSFVAETDGITKVTFSPDVAGDIKDDRYIYVFVESELINHSDFYLEDANTIVFNFPLEAGEEVTMIIETDRYLLSVNNLGLKYSTLHVEKQGQTIFELPYEGKPKSYILFKNGLLVDSNDYSINNNKLIMLYQYNDLQIGDELVAVCSIDSSSDMNAVNYYQYSVEITDPNMIDIPEYNGTSFSTNNVLLFIEGSLVNKNYYTISSNTIYLEDGIAQTGYNASIVVAYKTLNPNTVQTTTSSLWTVNFDKVEVKATQNNQATFEVPNPPTAAFSPDYKFLLMIRGMFVPEIYYTFSEDRKYITLENADNILAGDIITFMFCSNYGFTFVDKKEYTVEMPSTKEVTLNIFANTVNLYERMMVFYGSVFIDPSRYQINNTAKTIKFDDTVKFDSSKKRNVTFIFFFTGNSENGMVGYLPATGYMYFNDKEIDRNFNKNMYILFINGKKVIQKNILDVTNAIKKVTADIHSRYGMEVLGFAPKILEFYDKYRENNESFKYTLTVPDTENQKVVINCNGITHSTSFTTNSGNTYVAHLVPNKGYKAGTITPSAGFVNEDVTFTITPATKAELAHVEIVTPEHAQIVVSCNGRTYTDSFDETAGSNFTAEIYPIDPGYDCGNLNYTSGTVINGTTITASNSTIHNVSITIMNQNLSHQTVVSDIYEMDHKVHTIYFNDGTINMDYGAYALFTIKADSGYEAGDSVGLFKPDTVYTITQNYDNLVVKEPKGPYVVASNIATLANQTIYVITEDTDGTIKKYDSSFITKKNIKYSIVIEADPGYKPGNIITNTGETEGYMTGTLAVTATPATEDPSYISKDEVAAKMKELENEPVIANKDAVLTENDDGIDILCICPYKNEVILVETSDNLYIEETVRVKRNSKVNIYVKAIGKKPEGILYINNNPISEYQTTIDTTGMTEVICEVK